MGKADYTLIFIVEDDKFYADVIRKALESRNFMNIKTFATGEDCLKHLDLKPEIVLLDYRLGEDVMDGMDVLKSLRKSGLDAQVIFLTGVDKLEVATNTIKAGAYDYVVKSEAAIERIRNIIRRITFENHIKRENLLLRRSRKIILTIIFLLAIGILVLGALQVMR
ncbi:MAG: response regulator [Bacteroidetes bacterium]|nr:MAG: response regulator [Bacteroidota bacterium]